MRMLFAVWYDFIITWLHYMIMSNDHEMPCVAKCWQEEKLWLLMRPVTIMLGWKYRLTGSKFVVKNLPIMPVFCSILWQVCYAQNYFGIIGTGLINSHNFSSCQHLAILGISWSLYTHYHIVMKSCNFKIIPDS